MGAAVRPVLRVVLDTLQICCCEPDKALMWQVDSIFNESKRTVEEGPRKKYDDLNPREENLSHVKGVHASGGEIMGELPPE